MFTVVVMTSYYSFRFYRDVSCQSKITFRVFLFQVIWSLTYDLTTLYTIFGSSIERQGKSLNFLQSRSASTQTSEIDVTPWRNINDSHYLYSVYDCKGICRAQFADNMLTEHGLCTLSTEISSINTDWFIQTRFKTQRLFQHQLNTYGKNVKGCY